MFFIRFYFSFLQHLIFFSSQIKILLVRSICTNTYHLSMDNSREFLNIISSNIKKKIFFEVLTLIFEFKNRSVYFFNSQVNKNHPISWTHLPATMISLQFIREQCSKKINPHLSRQFAVIFLQAFRSRLSIHCPRARVLIL